MACMGNWVCFECRITKRRPTWNRVTYYNPDIIGMRSSVKCQQCRLSMYFLGPTMQIPPKNKIKEWQQLYQKIISLRLYHDKHKQIHRVKMKHTIEKQVKALKSRGSNKEREQLIKQYEAKLLKYS